MYAGSFAIFAGCFQRNVRRFYLQFSPVVRRFHLQFSPVVRRFHLQFSPVEECTTFVFRFLLRGSFCNFRRKFLCTSQIALLDTCKAGKQLLPGVLGGRLLPGVFGGRMLPGVFGGRMLPGVFGGRMLPDVVQDVAPDVFDVPLSEDVVPPLVHLTMNHEQLPSTAPLLGMLRSITPVGQLYSDEQMANPSPSSSVQLNANECLAASAFIDDDDMPRNELPEFDFGEQVGEQVGKQKQMTLASIQREIMEDQMRQVGRGFFEENMHDPDVITSIEALTGMHANEENGDRGPSPTSLVKMHQSVTSFIPMHTEETSSQRGSQGCEVEDLSDDNEDDDQETRVRDSATTPVLSQAKQTTKATRPTKQPTKKVLSSVSTMKFKTPKVKQKNTRLCSACGSPGHYHTTCYGQTLKQQMGATDQTNLPGSAGKQGRGKATRCLVFSSPTQELSRVPVQIRVQDILSTTEVQVYIQDTLVGNILKYITHQKMSVLGINGFTIDFDEFTKHFHSIEAQEKNLTWQEFREMIGACGFQRVDLDSDQEKSLTSRSSGCPYSRKAILKYEWCLTRCWLMSYRYASKSKVTQETFLQNKKKNVCKCPQILAYVYEQVRQRMIQTRILSKRQWVGHDKKLNMETITVLKTLLNTSAESVFFPFFKLEYDKKILPMLFTVFKDDYDYQTSHQNMKLSRQFLSHLPIYFEWIMKTASSISTL